MEKYASREAFGIARDVIGSTRRCTIDNKFIVMILKYIMTPSFVSLDMFVVCIFRYNDDCPGYHLAAMMSLMPMRLYKRHDLS